jgi:uncharacterized membrane protein YkvA (DUF1232 family)
MADRHPPDEPSRHAPREPILEPYGRREASGAYEDEDDFDTDRDLEVSFESETPHSRARLLSFYDRLRERIVSRIEQRGGRLSSGAARALLLVPDVFILLVRLTLDRDVPRSTRALIGGALAYFLLPLDFLPELVLGPVGFMDDLVLAVAVLGQAFGDELEPYARWHWSGPEDLRVVLRDISTSADQLLGQKIYDRLRRFLGRRGVEMSGPE